MSEDIILFAGNKNRLFDGLRPRGFSAPDYRIPSIVKSCGNIVAAIDSASGGMDWGKIALSVKVSSDDGNTWSDEIRVAAPPCFKAPTENGDTTSAIYMDPLMVSTGNKIIFTFDMFPESKGMHAPDRLSKTDGFCEIDGKKYPMLFTTEQSVSKLKRKKTATGYNCYTLREDGFVYDPDGVKTKYYCPKNHDPSCFYETMGDMYYGDGEFLEKYPPLYPENTKDIYVGNIYLTSDKPKFSDTPERVVKKHYTELYDCPEAPAAPLGAAVTCYLWQSESTDGGLTWSQPVNITPEVKRGKDGKFFGTGPGIGIVLQRQSDKAKNGRILLPAYAVNRSAVIYSDDGGNSWNRGDSLYSKNVDETQLLELSDGRVMCLGRQKKIAKTPVSVSSDGGESFERVKPGELYSVKCQKSALALPLCGENGFAYADYMNPEKQYFVCAHPTGHGGKDSSRTDGVLSVCDINGTSIKTVKDIPLKNSEKYASFGEYADFFAYSSLVLTDDGCIGVFYEAYPSGCLIFKKVSLEQ